jgi:hypothetical protein
VFRHLYDTVQGGDFPRGLTARDLGLCVDAAMIGGPVVSDDMWFLTKVLFCIPAALVAGMFSKGRLVVWPKEFFVLILAFGVVAGLIWFRVATFDDNDHAPALWTNPQYDYSDVHKAGSAFKIGSAENGKFELFL